MVPEIVGASSCVWIVGAAGLIFAVSLGSSATMGWFLTVDQNLGVGEAFGLLLLNEGFVGDRILSMTLSVKQEISFQLTARLSYGLSRALLGRLSVASCFLSSI